VLCRVAEAVAHRGEEGEDAAGAWVRKSILVNLCSS
jgi:hypothetical protein